MKAHNNSFCHFCQKLKTLLNFLRQDKSLILTVDTTECGWSYKDTLTNCPFFPLGMSTFHLAVALHRVETVARYQSVALQTNRADKSFSVCDKSIKDPEGPHG